MIKENNDKSINNNDFDKCVFRVYSEKSKSFDEKLKPSDYARTMYISTFVDCDQYLKSDNKIKLTKKDIMSLIGVNKNIFGEWFKILTDNGILVEKVDGFVMSKEYCVKNKSVANDGYIKIFTSGIRELYVNNQGSNQKTLGIIMSVLPFVNFKNNMVCENPYEQSEECMGFISVGVMAKVLGYNYKYKRMMDAFDSIRFNNSESVVVFPNVSQSDKNCDLKMMINPRILYSGSSKNIVDVHDTFKRRMNNE